VISSTTIEKASIGVLPWKVNFNTSTCRGAAVVLHTARCKSLIRIGITTTNIKLRTRGWLCLPASTFLTSNFSKARVAQSESFFHAYPNESDVIPRLAAQEACAKAGPTCHRQLRESGDQVLVTCTRFMIPRAAARGSNKTLTLNPEHHHGPVRRIDSPAVRCRTSACAPSRQQFQATVRKRRGRGSPDARDCPWPSALVLSRDHVCGRLGFAGELSFPTTYNFMARDLI